MHRTSVAILALAVLSGPCMAQSSFFHVVDVPTDLSGTTFLPSEIVRFDASTSTYSTAVTLPGSPPVDAIHHLANGDWLLSVAVPTDLDGATYDARDVIRFNGTVYALEVDGAAAGIPAGSNVDALTKDGADLIFGFDVPTTLGGTTYDRNDLVRLSSGVFSIFFDASAAGVPATSDVIGAAANGGDLVLTFDIATDLGGTTYLPGELVVWDGVSFASFHNDPSWPGTSVMRALALDAPGGSVPGTVPATLRVDRAAGGSLQLTWDASCSGDAADYAIYEGELGNWYSHTMHDCSDDGGDLTETVVPSGGSRYYLVVPQDAVPNEGSYGQDGSGADRPAGALTCATPVGAGC